MALLPEDAALLVIDVQKGFDAPGRGRRNNPGAEENIVRLLAAWRDAARPIIYVQHLSKNPASPFRPGQDGCEIKELVRPQPGEPVIQKRVNCAFIGTDLESRLRENNLYTLVITGLSTPHCVSTTARMAGDLGFKTYVVSDATAAFDLPGPDGKTYDAEEIHNLSLVALHDEFAEIIETASLLEQLR
ncbi:MAG: cysteine hydrolase [Acidobacteria bacterium]|nr:cysteine hydrolase [Acidobacteriota bacterium]